MKEWICEEVPALTIDGKVFDTMLLMKKELVRCSDCKHFNGDFCDYVDIVSRISGDWFCPDGERKET